VSAEYSSVSRARAEPSANRLLEQRDPEPNRIRAPTDRRVGRATILVTAADGRWFVGEVQTLFPKRKQAEWFSQGLESGLSAAA
jgi:hypothetical protein